MEGDRRRILLVEDDEAELQAFERLFQRESLPYDLVCVRTASEAERRLSDSNPDLVIIDHQLQDGTGLDVQVRARDTPCIYISGAADLSAAVEAMKAGAADFLVKDQAREYLELVPLTIEAVIRQRENADALRRAEAALKESEERHRLMFEQSPNAIILVDAETGELAAFNDTACTQLGYDREEFAGLRISDLEAVESPEEVRAHIDEITRTGSARFETRHHTKSGEVRDVLVSSRKYTTRGRTYLQSVWMDLTERKQAERALEAKAAELRKVINLMAGRENRMVELKDAIRKLRDQLEEAGLAPTANDPLLED